MNPRPAISKTVEITIAIMSGVMTTIFVQAGFFRNPPSPVLPFRVAFFDECPGALNAISAGEGQAKGTLLEP